MEQKQGIESFEVTIEKIEDFLPMMFSKSSVISPMIKNKMLPVCVLIRLDDTTTVVYLEWDNTEHFVKSLEKIDLDKQLTDDATRFRYLVEIAGSFILTSVYNITRPNANFITFSVIVEPKKEEKIKVLN